MDCQMELKQNKYSQFQFYCKENSPSTLTITRKPKNLQDIIIKQATYVWIWNDDQFIKREIQKQADLKIYFVDSVEKVRQEFQEQKIIVVCHIQMIEKVGNILKQMIQLSTIKCLVFYEQCKNPELKIALFNKINTHYVDTKQKAIKLIKQDKFIYSGGFQNFISLEKQVWDSNILVKTIFAMIEQRTCTKKIIKDLVMLANMLYQNFGKIHIQNFPSSYHHRNFIQKQQAIKLYTSQSFLYRLVNRVLRISKDPTCIYIIQPYFTDLFKGVHQMYKKQQQEKFYQIGNQVRDYKNFICYRGGELSTNQIKFFQKNTGQYIQNLGFMSTSRIEYSASIFAKNVLFEIQVDDALRKSNWIMAFVMSANILLITNNNKKSYLILQTALKF